MKKFLLLFSLLIFTVGCENSSESSKENRMYFKAKVDGEYIVTDRIPTDTKELFVCLELTEKIENDTIDIYYRYNPRQSPYHIFPDKAGSNIELLINNAGSTWPGNHFVEASIRNKSYIVIPSDTLTVYERK